MVRKISSFLLALLLLSGIVFSLPAVGGFAEADGTGYYTITSQSGVNMRSGPGTNYSKVGVVPYNGLVNIKEISGVWGKTTFNGTTGWVSLDYAKKTDVGSSSSDHKKILDGLDTLRAKFPDGKYWNHYGSSEKNLDGWTNTPCPEGHMLNGVQQCNGQCDGFARKLGVDLFGLSTYSWEQRNTLDGLCVGDIIRYRNHHSIMVTGFTKNNDTLVIADCNWDYHCGIRWDRYFSISSYIGSGNFYVLHYPGNTLTKEAYFNELVPEIKFEYSEYTISQEEAFEIDYEAKNLFDYPTWTSSKPEIATVDDYGFVCAISPGTAVITADYEGRAKASCTVKVTEYMDIIRLSGDNRIETSAEIADDGWYDGAENVILANAYTFADALAGVPLAKALDAPILLTGNTALGIEDILAEEIEDINAKNIYILGGEGVISKKIEDSLKASYNVIRLSGPSRFDTAVEIAEELGEINGTPEKAFAVTALDYPDALSVSSVAGILGAPIIYVNKDGSIDDATSDYISTNKIKSVDIIGGEGAISNNVMTNLEKCGVDPKSVERLSGKNRFSTCLAVNNKYISCFTEKAVALATGYAYPDALSGGALAAKLEIPILLTEKGTTIPEGTYEFMKKFEPTGLYVFGGEGVVSDRLVYLYTDFR